LVLIVITKADDIRKSTRNTSLLIHNKERIAWQVV
jgi:hypothetical protein